MHNVDIDLVEMSLDVVKFAINRIADNHPQLGFPKSECELKKLVGETVTPDGITGEKAFAIFSRPSAHGERADQSSATLSVRARFADARRRDVRPRDLGGKRSRRVLARRRGLYFRRESGDALARFPDRNAGGRVRRLHERRHGSESVGDGRGARKLARPGRK
jgi:hypothetical protein